MSHHYATPVARPPSGPLRFVLLMPAVILCVSLGCSKEKLTEAINEAKAKTQSIADSAMTEVEERLPESGSIALQMDASTDPIQRAGVELISIGDGRPNVVQLASYDPSKSSRSYPAVLIHGTTNSSTASALSGETVECDMYYQASPTSPVAMTNPGSSVALTFDRMIPEDNALTASLGMVELIGSDDQPIRINGGEIIAVIRGEGK
ncbi:MAG: hypothetical protein ACR2NZ_08870 [Rubripirellula sp.]